MEIKSPLREMLALTGAAPYRSLATLEEAQRDPHGIVVLEGDDGGTVYAVIPAREVACSMDALLRLLVELDEIKWPGNDADMRHLYFESAPVGQTIPGGMGAGIVRDGIWVHADFVKLGLSGAISQVISGERASLQG